MESENREQAGWHKNGILLITSPINYWKQLSAHRPSVNDMLTNYMLPWLGVTSLIVFALLWFNNAEMAYLDGLRKAVVVFAYLFFNIYGVAWVFDKLSAVFNINTDFPSVFIIVASGVPLLCFEILLSAMMPTALFLKVILLYLVFLYYLGFIYIFNFKKIVALISSLFIFVSLTAISMAINFILQYF